MIEDHGGTGSAQAQRGDDEQVGRVADERDIDLAAAVRLPHQPADVQQRQAVLARIAADATAAGRRLVAQRENAVDALLQRIVAEARRPDDRDLMTRCEQRLGLLANPAVVWEGLVLERDEDMRAQPSAIIVQRLWRDQRCGAALAAKRRATPHDAVMLSTRPPVSGKNSIGLP